MQTHALLFIQDLATIMLIAGVMAILCYRLKQPVVFGYIVAGIIAGPHTPPFSFISDQITISTLAELGVIFLMFSLGLEFNLRKLKKVGFPAFIAAFAEIVLMLWIGYEVGHWLKWSQMDSIFLGAILAVSSTTIIVKALNELGMKKERFAQLIFGVLVIEDIFAIIILALLSSNTITGTLHAKDIMLTVTQLLSFLVASFVVGIMLVPKLLAYVEKFQNDEVLLITLLGICFGFCLLVVKLNYSVALGAFMIGAIISEAKQLKKIHSLIIPFRDMFSAIFFVSVGLMLDPQALITYAWPIIGMTVVVVIGKVLTCNLGMLLSGQDGRTAMRVGMGLAQIGEFSFIIASLGITMKVTSDFLYPIAVAVSAITTLLTPYLIKHSDAFTLYMRRFVPEKIATVFEIYSTWVQGIKPERDQLELTKVVNRSLLQVIVNLFIVTSIFLFSAYLAKTQFGLLAAEMMHVNVQKMLFWGAALLLSLPFLIAIYLKITALSMILAELSVKKKIDSQFNLHVRQIISGIIPIISIVEILLFVIVLSTSILPPVELLIIVLVIVGALMFLLYPWFVKFHSKLQINLFNSLKK